MTGTKIKWTTEEAVTVLRDALPLSQSHGISLARAIHASQGMLPASRQRGLVPIRASLVRGQFELALGIVKSTLSPDPSITEEAPAKCPPEKQGGFIRWRTSEGARLAVAVDGLRNDGKNRHHNGKPWRLRQYFATAQALVLPPERRRSWNALGQADQTGKLARILEEGRQHAWAHTPPTPPAPPPVTMGPAFEFNAPAPEKPAMTFPGPAATNAAERFQVALSEMLAAHAEYVAQTCVASVLPGLIQTFRGEFMNAINSRLDDIAKAATLGIENLSAGNLHYQVRTILEKELGPLSPEAGAPSPQPQAPEVLEPVKGEPEVKKTLALDVIGLLPGQAQIVKQHVGTLANLRFITSDDAPKVRPRDISITCVKFINHSSERKIEKHRGEIVRVNGTAHAVINAVRAIVEKTAQAA